MSPNPKFETNYNSIARNIKNMKEETMEEFVEFEKYITYENGEPVLWVFGYGSLIWYPNFEYNESAAGFIKGYGVRFWQGNTAHRGTPQSPARVATLIREEESIAWGKAFQLRGKTQINRALEHLCHREMTLGGYTYESMDFYLHRASHERKCVKTITFIATPDNSDYLGPAPISDMANTIVNTKGKCGHNLEYLFRLTDSLREILPGVVDDHLWGLEDACHVLLTISENMKNECSSADEYVSHCLSTRKEMIKKSHERYLIDGVVSNNSYFNARQD